MWPVRAGLGEELFHLSCVSQSNADIPIYAWFGQYQDFALEFSQVLPGTNSVNGRLQTSNDSASSFELSAGAYGYAIAGTVTTANSTGDTTLLLNPDQAGQEVGNTVIDGGMSGVIVLPNWSNPSAWPAVYWNLNFVNDAATPIYESVTGCGSRRAAGIANAVRFNFNTGVITSGEITLYGRGRKRI